jgi:diadenosine tetraphosphate (Ap4A) HIT family hydrolase
MSDGHCELCAKVASRERLVHEFEHSLLVVGAHQRFEGYCVLISKEHRREPFELPPAFHEELMRAARALQQAFSPWKINYGCYGNQVPHVHWHLFPRYEGDPMLKQVPWMQSPEFDRHLTTSEQAQAVIRRIRPLLT